MTAAARRCQRRRRSSLVVHIHVDEEAKLELTLMRVSGHLCPSAAVGRSAVGGFLEGSLGGLILAITPSITVGDVTIVEHFVK